VHTEDPASTGVIRRDGHGRARSTDPSLRHHSLLSCHLLHKKQYLRKLTGVVHNHPSGSPEPSRQDIDVTRQIIEAGKRLNIAVHDHIIVGAQGHVSMRAKGLL
jgi:proteasome lid subunit RPN8/RPN11